MLTAENIQAMSRKNVSVNDELTKARTKEVLKSATRKQKNDIDALAGVKRVSINRVYTVGTISAKIAVAIAQTLNIDPSYLTGDKDERGECTDVTLDAFLIDKGYAKLSKLRASARKPRGKNAKKTVGQAAPIPVEQPIAEPVPPATEPADSETRRTAELTEDEAVQLLRALYLRANFGGEAAGILTEIQTLLV